MHVLGLEGETFGQPLAGGADGPGGAVAGGLQPLEQGGAALAERVDHGIAGMAERERDVLALLGERAGDALRHLVDFLGHQIADRGDVVRQVEMHAGDGVAHLFGLVDQRLPLARQFAQQVADADFVVVIGALERGHLVMHQRFQLGGARQRALDAVAHGGDLAPDRLADGDDRLACGGLRLRQPHRHLGHGLGDKPQVLRTAEHMGEHEEGDDGCADGGDEPDQGGDSGARHGHQALQLGRIEHDGGCCRGGPYSGGDGGDDIGQAARAAVQGLQNLANGFAVIIGGAAGRAFLAGPFGHLGLVLMEEVGGEARLDRNRPPLRLRLRHQRFHRVLRLAPTKRLFDGRERLFGRVFGLLRNIGHCGRRLVVTPDLCRAPRLMPLGHPTRAGSFVRPSATPARRTPQPLLHPIALAIRKKPARLGLFHHR